jgi:hypothetical protein
VNSTDPSILVVCPWPYPPTNGTRTHIWGLIRFFRRIGWKVVLAIGVWPEKARKVEALSGGALPEGIDAQLFSRAPRWSNTEAPEAVSIVQGLIDRYRPVVVWCHYADLVPLVSALDRRGAQLWFRTHNFELAQHFEKMLERRPRQLSEGHFPLVEQLQWAWSVLHSSARIFAVERRMHRLADRIFFNSQADMRAMTRIYGPGKASDWVIPFVDCERVPINAQKTILDVAYLGSGYGSRMQLSGALYLMEQVIPAVEAAMPRQFRFQSSVAAARPS